MVERSPAERLAALNGHGPTTDDLVSMVRDGSLVIGEAECPDLGRLTFEAANIRNTVTGVHAHLTIGRDDAVLADHTLNIGREDERAKLANAAADLLADRKAHAGPIKLRLGQFCRKVWVTWTQGDEAQWTQGQTDHQPSFMLDPYIVREGGTILYGPPGATKSWTALMWAAGMCVPEASLWPTQGASVMFVNLERSAKSIDWRIARIGKALGTSFKLLTLTARGRSLSDIWDAARRSVEKEKVDCVIVDSLSRAGSGDLTNNEPANRAMDALNALAPTWVVIAHTPRSDDTHVFGSVMLEAAADLCVRLQSVAHTTRDDLVGMRLSVTKANDVKKARGVTWALEFDDGGLHTFRKALDGEFPDLAPSQSVSDQVADYLKVSGKAGGSELASELGLERGAVSMVLHRDRRFVRAGREGRKVMYGLAETRLREGG